MLIFMCSNCLCFCYAAVFGSGASRSLQGHPDKDSGHLDRASSSLSTPTPATSLRPCPGRTSVSHMHTSVGRGVGGSPTRKRSEEIGEGGVEEKIDEHVSEHVFLFDLFEGLFPRCGLFACLGMPWPISFLIPILLIQNGDQWSGNQFGRFKKNKKGR